MWKQLRVQASSFGLKKIRPRADAVHLDPLRFETYRHTTPNSSRDDENKQSGAHQGLLVLVEVTRSQ